MKRASIGVVVAMLLVLSFIGRATAQDKGDEDSKLNTNLGFNIIAPMSQTSNFVNVGGGFTAGAGYNFNRYHGFVGEFMWNHLGASDEALAPIRSALQTNDVEGAGNFFSLTGNYRFEVQGRTVGMYFIGGGGWYRRTAHISNHIATGQSISCTRTWEWWGFECQSGTVISNQTLASSVSDTMGGNAGFGVTFKKAEEPRYRFYMEARYHYAPTKNVKTQFIPVTFGIRF